MVNVIVSSAGVQGPRGNTVLTGTGAPSNTVGIDGDYYINTAGYPTSAILYGPRAAGAWPATGITLSGGAVTSVNSQTGAVVITAAGLGALLAANNLSDLSNAVTARTNLGLGTAATQASTAFDTAGAAAAAQTTAEAYTDTQITGEVTRANGAYLAKASNLADVASASTARTNLGLGGAATLNVGTTAGTVAAGDDSRVTGAAQKSANLSDVASAAAARTNLAVPPTSRQILTGTGLTGGGDLTADRTLTVTYGTTAGTTAQGNDTRLSDARTPLAHAASHATAGTDPITPASIGAVANSALDTSVLYQPTYRLPRYPQPAASLTEWQPGHGFTASGGTLTTDTTVFVRGTQCVRYVSPGDNATYNVTGTISSTDTTARLLRIVVRVEDITVLQSLDVQLATDGTFANGWAWTAQGTTGTSTYITSGDWVLMSLGFADATALGTAPRSGLTALRVRIRDTGAAVTVRLQAAELVADGSAVFPNGVVVITADDCYQSLVDMGKAKLDTYGYPVTEYVIADRVGLSGRMTLQELQDLQASSGWELACHAYLDSNHGLTYAGITAAALDADARAMKAYAVQNGFRGADLFALPKGATGKTTDSVSIIPILEKYFSTVATTVNKTREVFPPSDPFRVRRISAISSFTGGYAPATITGAGGDLDKVKANGGVLVLNFHQIVASGPTDTTMLLQSDFNAIIDAINSKGIPVLTMGELMRYALTSASSGAAIDTSTIPKKLGAIGSAGVSTLASAADHVHPRAQWSPEDHGYLTWTQDPATCSAGQLVPTAGTVNFARLHVPVATTVTNLVMFVSVAGSGLTSGQCFAGLYNSAGTLLSATADQSVAWASTGTKTVALSAAQAVAAGDYLVGFFYNGTTAPTLLRGVSQSAVNAGLSASTSRYGTAATGQTTSMPNAIGTLAGASNSWWVALS